MQTVQMIFQIKGIQIPVTRIQCCAPVRANALIMNMKNDNALIYRIEGHALISGSFLEMKHKS